MILDAIIRRMRLNCPTFERRVAGATDANDWLMARAMAERGESGHGLSSFALVLPVGTRLLRDVGDEQRPRETIVEHLYQIQVTLPAVGDERNQNAATQWETVRDEICNALLWWRAGRDQHPARFRGAEISVQVREYSLWLLNIAIPETWRACVPADDVLPNADLSDLTPAPMREPGFVLVPRDCHEETCHPPLPFRLIHPPGSDQCPT